MSRSEQSNRITDGASSVKRIEKLLAKHLEAHPTILGEAITVATPDWAWSGAAGGVPGSEELLTERHSFRIASVTKPFVAAAILRLMEMGDIDITLPIREFASHDTDALLTSGGYDTSVITVRHLLNHTSGIASFADIPAFMEVVRAEANRRWTRGEQIEFAMEHGHPTGEPGRVFAYSDTGYVVLGDIIQRQTGESLGPAVRNLLDYAAIGLKDTYWEQLEPQPRPAPFSGALLDGVDMTRHDHSFDLYGGGGLISTTDDIARFLRALFEGGVFARSSTLAALMAVPPVRRGEHQPLLANGVVLEPVGRFLGVGHTGFWGQWAYYCLESGVVIAWTRNNNDDVGDDSLFVRRVADALDMA